MTDAARTVLETALDLDDRARAEIAAELLASLEDDVETDVEPRWAAEVNRRARDVVDNGAETIDWAEVRARVSQRRQR